jgi:hypothetical protein
LHEKALAVAADPEIDETFYPCVFAADPEDPIDDAGDVGKSKPEPRRVSVNIDELRRGGRAS